MLESCFCGRTGEIENREPLVTKVGGRALGCPDCGHLDHLEWLPEEARRRRSHADAACAGAASHGPGLTIERAEGKTR
jgi:hypothetical protein